MTIKIRFHGDMKAIIRWKTPIEKEFLKRQLTAFRDLSPGVPISVKNEKGEEMPKVHQPPRMMPVSGQPISSSGLNSIVVKVNEEKK